ncbi:MAG: hypothetical protein HOP08_12635 [Cyclobacteriaceae bacterium]|nr:hypothetical protein [Cyclobacteriaceae bacterium]
MSLNRCQKCWTLVLLLIFLSAPAYAQESGSDVKTRIIIIGDPGKLHDGKNAVVEAARQFVSPDDSKTTILFLGDNIYPKGLEDEEDKSYPASANVLKTILTSFKDYQAKVFVVPGNHDWQRGRYDGWQNVKRQQQFVKDLNQPNTIFLPEAGCPGPEEVTIDDNLVLIIMDTQWWLHQNPKPGINDNCDCKTEEDVIARLKDIVHRNPNKKFLFASHHPLRSYGEHGGYYTWKQHIFPLTGFSEKAYVPLPVIGSLYPIVRGKFGNIEDLIHPDYKEMIRGIEKSMATAPDVTYAGGHDHNLQLIREGNRNHIISGSGTNRSQVKKGKGSLFASDQNGFAEIIYTIDGKQIISFYEVDEHSIRKEVYRFEVPEIIIEKRQNEIASKEISDDSITVRIAPEYDQVGKSHRAIWGEHYRKIWATPVTIKVFHVNEQNGGLKILKKGGGQQTKSLRMEDKNGKQWVLRTIQKNPEMALPSNLRATVAKSIIQDQISAANPFAPLTVPVIAEAANVPHSNPQILFVPDDPALGIYQSEFANTVCIFEEREPGADETYSTDDVLKKLEKDNDNSVDQKAVLRARMLDLLIGDWDRHEDQWRWKQEKTDKKSIYSPIPRDRDQVFFISTGFVPSIARLKWIMPKFQGFGDEIRDVNGFMFNARYFDRSFLNGLNEKDWQEVISGVQTSVTDDIIRQSIGKLPDTVYKQIGEKLIHNLISRRNSLMTEGLTYYNFLSREIDIPASDKKDLIHVETLSNGDAKISLQKIKKDGIAGDVFYQRVIDNAITKEVRLYGRGDEDVFVVDGNYKPGFKLRLVGGGSVDSIYVSRSAAKRSKLLIYDRSDKKNVFPDHGVRLLTSTSNDVNLYNPRAFNYNKLAPLATIAFNLDDGILLGAGGVFTKYGFRREPFASRHRIMVGHALATDASFLRYKGDVTNFIGKAALDMYLNVAAPDNTVNFFGVGNETTFDNVSDPQIRYYRTRYNFIDTQVRLKFALAKSFNFFAGVAGQYYNMDPDDNKDRFVNIYAAQQSGPTLFDHRVYLGGVAGYEVDTRNNSMLPVRGFHWRTSFTGMQQVNAGNSFGQVRTEMSMYISFNRYPKFVIAHRIGAGTSIGDPEFFQMFYMGGDGGLLGYRKNRFAGNSMLYDNLELRIKLFDFTSYLFPGSVGMVLFNDVGRVWAKNESSDLWHWGYGGGFYIIPAESIVITGVAGYSQEGVLPYVNLGFRF